MLLLLAKHFCLGNTLNVHERVLTFVEKIKYYMVVKTCTSNLVTTAEIQMLTKRTTAICLLRRFQVVK